MKVNVNGKSVNVPNDFIEKNMRNLGITQAEAIEMFLSDEGYIVNDTVVELTEKVKAAGPISHDAAIGKAKRKAPERKPDERKREIIDMLAEFIRDQLAPEAEVTNIERMIAFEVGGEKFELTLTKKRKPKE